MLQGIPNKDVSPQAINLLTPFPRTPLFYTFPKIHEQTRPPLLDG